MRTSISIFSVKMAYQTEMARRIYRNRWTAAAGLEYLRQQIRKYRPEGIQVHWRLAGSAGDRVSAAGADLEAVHRQ